MSYHDQVFIGSTPDGSAIYASPCLLEREGISAVLSELVESHWHRAGLLPPGYKFERVSPFNEATRIVPSASRKQIVEEIAQRMRAVYDQLHGLTRPAEEA